MKPYPHHYHATASGGPEGIVEVSSESLPLLETAPPAEFGGPGDRWSPETLLTAAVADCFILTFRAIARASQLDWQSLQCQAEGILDRVDGQTRFKEFSLRATLQVPSSTSEDRAQRLLEKAERSCLVTNSLAAPCHLVTEVRTAASA